MREEMKEPNWSMLYVEKHNKCLRFISVVVTKSCCFYVFFLMIHYYFRPDPTSACQHHSGIPEPYTEYTIKALGKLHSAFSWIMLGSCTLRAERGVR